VAEDASLVSTCLQGTFGLRQGQDKVLRRIGTVFQEHIPDESVQPLRLPSDPTSTLPTPSVTTPHSVATAAQPRLELSKQQPQQWEHTEAGAAEGPQVKGPAAPSDAIRRAAARAAVAMRERGLLGGILEGVSEQLVGPVPLAMVAEVEGAATDERLAEVTRILAIVAKAKQKGV
jgi:hypothetical protein